MYLVPSQREVNTLTTPIPCNPCIPQHRTQPEYVPMHREEKEYVLIHTWSFNRTYLNFHFSIKIIMTNITHVPLNDDRAQT